LGDESDEVIPPDAERQFAQRMGADTIEVASGHAHDFVAEGDKVVVLTPRELEGEATEGADLLTFNDAGKLVRVEALGDTAQLDRVFAK